MFINKKLDWTSENRKLLADFLESDTGKLMLGWLAEHAPELLDGSDNGKTLVASGCLKGYNKALSEILLLTREQPIEIQSSNDYPDLDDDSKWNGAQPK